MDNITALINSLTTDIVETSSDEWMKHAVEDLEEKLSECRQKPSDIYRILTVSQWPAIGNFTQGGLIRSLFCIPCYVRQCPM